MNEQFPIPNTPQFNTSSRFVNISAETRLIWSRASEKNRSRCQDMIRPILDQIDCDQCSFFLFLSYFVVRRVSQFYSISYLQLKSPKEDIMAVSQCCLCCPLVFCAIFALLPFFLFLRCQRPCAAPLPVVYTILDISETSFFVTPIGFLSTQNR